MTTPPTKPGGEPGATPSSEPGSGLPVPSPRQPRKKPSHTKRRLLIAGGCVAVLAAVGVWQATTELPFLTHNEVIAIALAVENASSVEAVRGLVASDGPVPPIPLPGLPDPPTGVAEWLHACKTTNHYTYLGSAGERTKNTRLRFRVHAEQQRGAENELRLVDYHELRIDRRAGKVVVVDVSSLLCGGWFSELAKQRAGIAKSMASPEGNAFTAALAGNDAKSMLATFRALDEPARKFLGNGAALLGALSARDVGDARDAVFREAMNELTTLHPNARTFDLWLLYHVQVHGVDATTRAEALNAVERLEPRVEDGEWMRGAKKKLQPVKKS